MIQDLQNCQNQLKSCWMLGEIPTVPPVMLVTCLQAMNDALSILALNLQRIQS